VDVPTILGYQAPVRASRPGRRRPDGQRQSL